MTRWRLCLLWAACAVSAPFLLLMQLAQALFGSPARSLSMAIACDEWGNALLGGDPDMTISARTGLGVMAGLRWAKLLAPCVDYLFGAGHCRAQAVWYRYQHG